MYDELNESKCEHCLAGNNNRLDWREACVKYDNRLEYQIDQMNSSCPVEDGTKGYVDLTLH